MKLISYIFACFITIGYIICMKSSNNSTDIIDSILKVFLPSTALALGVCSKIKKNDITVVNKSVDKIEKLKACNEISGNRCFEFVNITIDSKINYNIGFSKISKFKNFYYLVNCTIVFITVAFIFIKNNSINLSSLILSTTSISILISDMILVYEKEAMIRFDVLTLKGTRKEIENDINNFLEMYMGNRIKYYSIQKFNNELYFIIAYVKPRVLERILENVFSVIWLMVILVYGINRLVELFPALLGYATFYFNGKGDELYKSNDTIYVKVKEHSKECKIENDFYKIQTFSHNKMCSDIIYIRKSKLKAMLDYPKVSNIMRKKRKKITK